MNRNRRELKIFIYVLAFFGIFQVINYFVKQINVEEDKSFEKIVQHHNQIIEDIENEGEKVSWEDVKFYEYEKRRKGPGEQGEPFSLTDPDEIKVNEGWYKKEGFYVLVSDKISVDRSMPDYRPPICKSFKYLKNLPKASVVVTFHNEIWSVLLRNIHSIFNRSPPELLHEIILINDASTYEHLGEQLERYIASPIFDGKVKMHKNDKREGLIRGRMIGARLSQADVIIFLDSHMEVLTGWLPPLLDPIVRNPTYATVPVVSGIFHTNMKPDTGGYGSRGHFDWGLTYKWYSVHPDEHPEKGENFDLPCMTGGAYAIQRKHFFDLEGYDEQLEIWNGENYELTFKLWLCSGGMTKVPCSRVNHLSKMHSAFRKIDDNSDFVGRNLKRVVEVWFDDYKKYFYGTNDERYEKIDAGDLTKQFAFKERMKCKGFQYYLDHVATELLRDYPLEPNYLFGGSLQLQSNKLCLGLQDMKFNKAGSLVECSEDLQKPKNGSFFVWTFDKEIRFFDYRRRCLDSVDMAFYYCHNMKGNQAWIYNPDTLQIKMQEKNKCVAGRELNQPIYLTECDANAAHQKWTWSIRK